MFNGHDCHGKDLKQNFCGRGRKKIIINQMKKNILKRRKYYWKRRANERDEMLG